MRTFPLPSLCRLSVKAHHEQITGSSWGVSGVYRLGDAWPDSGGLFIGMVVTSSGLRVYGFGGSGGFPIRLCSRYGAA